ncbi:MAG: hypothetical protein ACUVRZ_00835 [Desulfobacca sp.]|uniref:hypothetical protein n=1 Tax=Desulfobacca sp. TaxID=2067990 RepID=UPI00404AEB33
MLTLRDYLDNLRAAQAARRTAMKKVWAALEELAEADARLEEALALPPAAWQEGETGFLEAVAGDLLEGLPKEIAPLFRFGDLF